MEGNPLAIASSAMSFWFELATGLSVTQTALLRALTACVNAATYSSTLPASIE